MADHSGPKVAGDSGILDAGEREVRREGATLWRETQRLESRFTLSVAIQQGAGGIDNAGPKDAGRPCLREDSEVGDFKLKWRRRGAQVVETPGDGFHLSVLNLAQELQC